MAFDFKKEYREFYLPKARPELVTVPPTNYMAVRGQGDPNREGGAYQASIGMLYTAAFTIKMSKLGDRRIEGYFDFVVPPLEGFWQGVGGPKEDFRWVSVIRLPDFVTREDLAWAVEEAARKKGRDISGVEFLTVEEGICVQMLHVGPYDDEARTLAAMDSFLTDHGLENDLSDRRWHHEIYLSDARRTAPERLRTVIRHPVRKIEP